MFVHRYFFEKLSGFDEFFVGKFSASKWSRSKIFLNTHVLNLAVCLIFLFVILSVKLRQCPRNFGMFLNDVGLLYIWKIVIVQHIDLFTGHFTNFNTLIFFVHF